MTGDIFNSIKQFARRAGRVAARQALRFYYVLKYGDLTASERILVYAALVYVIVPGDIIPRRIFHIIGLVDDAAAVAYVVRVVQKKITPVIEQRVEMKLDEWFGYQVSEIK